MRVEARKDGRNRYSLRVTGPFAALADNVVLEEHESEKEGPTLAERTITVNQAIERDAIAGILCLIEDAVTALVTPKGHNEIKRKDNGLRDMLHGLFNKTIDENLNSVAFESRFLRKVGEAKTSP